MTPLIVPLIVQSGNDEGAAAFDDIPNSPTQMIGAVAGEAFFDDNKRGMQVASVIEGGFAVYNGVANIDGGMDALMYGIDLMQLISNTDQFMEGKESSDPIFKTPSACK